MSEVKVNAKKFLSDIVMSHRSGGAYEINLDPKRKTKVNSILFELTLAVNEDAVLTEMRSALHVRNLIMLWEKNTADVDEEQHQYSFERIMFITALATFINTCH